MKKAGSAKSSSAPRRSRKKLGIALQASPMRWHFIRSDPNLPRFVGEPARRWALAFYLSFIGSSSARKALPRERLPLHLSLFSLLVLFTSDISSAAMSSNNTHSSYATVAANTHSSSGHPPAGAGAVSLPPRTKPAEGAKPVWSLQAGPGGSDQVPLGGHSCCLLPDYRAFR